MAVFERAARAYVVRHFRQGLMRHACEWPAASRSRPPCRAAAAGPAIRGHTRLCPQGLIERKSAPPARLHPTPHSRVCSGAPRNIMKRRAVRRRIVHQHLDRRHSFLTGMVTSPPDSTSCHRRAKPRRGSASRCPCHWTSAGLTYSHPRMLLR